MSELRIESGWLVRDVNEHTCGSSSGTEWPYAHEPGCGTIPELRLDNLPCWPGVEAERLRAALTDLIDEWEDTGRGDSHPLIRGAALSAAGRVRGVLHELLNPTEGEKNNG